MFTRSRAIRQSKLGRFGLVGLVNTAVGYLVIVAALSLGLNDFAANAAGYAVGLTVSYVLNSKWTFRDRARSGSAGAARYLGVFIVAYGANLLVIVMAGELGYQKEPLVHLIGTCLYVVLFFLGARHFAFPEQGATR